MSGRQHLKVGEPQPEVSPGSTVSISPAPVVIPEDGVMGSGSSDRSAWQRSLTSPLAVVSPLPRVTQLSRMGSESTHRSISSDLSAIYMHTASDMHLAELISTPGGLPTSAPPGDHCIRKMKSVDWTAFDQSGAAPITPAPVITPRSGASMFRMPVPALKEEQPSAGAVVVVSEITDHSAAAGAISQVPTTMTQKSSEEEKEIDSHYPLRISVTPAEEPATDSHSHSRGIELSSGFEKLKGPAPRSRKRKSRKKRLRLKKRASTHRSSRGGPRGGGRRRGGGGGFDPFSRRSSAPSHFLEERHSQWLLADSPQISAMNYATPDLSEIDCSPMSTPYTVTLRDSIIGGGKQSKSVITVDRTTESALLQDQHRYYQSMCAGAKDTRAFSKKAKMRAAKIRSAEMREIQIGEAALYDNGIPVAAEPLPRFDQRLLSRTSEPLEEDYEEYDSGEERDNDEDYDEERGPFTFSTSTRHSEEAIVSTARHPSAAAVSRRMSSLGPRKQKEGWSLGLVWFVMCVNIGGFLIGFVGALLNPILSDVYTSCEIESTTLKGLLVSTSAAGGFLGAGIGIITNSRWGRKYSIIFSDFWMVLGSLAVLSTSIGGGDEDGVANQSIFDSPVSPNSIIIARLIQGVGVGLAGMSIPIYLSEIAPPAVRGGTMSVHAASQMLGQLSAIGICVVIFEMKLSEMNVFYWKWILVFVTVPCTVHMLLMLCFPQSPRWLVEKNRLDEAVEVLVSLDKSVCYDATDFTHKRKRAKDQSVKMRDIYKSVAKNKYALWTSITDIAFRNALLIGCGLAVFQQLSGINTLMNYSTTIIESMGLAKTQKEAVIWSLPIVAMQFIAAIGSVKMIDKSGRKPLLTYSLIGVFISLLFLSVACFMVAYLNAMAQAMQSAQGHDYKDPALLVFMRWCILAAILLYICAYAPGLGPVPVAVNSEIFPTQQRGLGACTFIMVTWLSSSVVTLLFPVLSALGGMGTAFGFSCVCSFFGILFVRVYVFETKGRDLEKITRGFSVANLQESRKRSVTPRPYV